MTTYEQIGYEHTNITSGFWHNRQTLNEQVTAKAVYDRFKETHRFEALSCSWTPENTEYKPHIFWDSDIAKWIEGVAYILLHHKNPELEELADAAIADILASQEETGYYNCYYLVMQQEERFTKRSNHELYCAGHLFEAAVAYYQATGKDAFLKGMCKYADYIYQIFVVEQSAAFTTCGHPEIELALVRLYEATHNDKYLELAKFFIDQHGNNDKEHGFYSSFNEKYAQDHAPLRLQDSAEGHAVRAAYLYCGMADIARLYSDEELFSACRKIFNNMTEKKMYITGATGSIHKGEAYTVDYDLPNATAYAETCAAIANALFANRMLLMEPDSKYADLVERELYNGTLSGWSLDGKKFFYENPLEINPKDHNVNVSVLEQPRLPIMERVECFSTSCCPPNIIRFISSVGNLLYTCDENTLYVHQYINSETNYRGCQITQTTNYPADGEITLHIKGTYSCVAVRIPYWCQSFTINHAYTIKNGYAYISVSDDEVIKLLFAMEPVLYEANPKVQQDCGKVCLMYGPLVYCLEEADNGEYLKDISIDTKTSYKVVYEAEYGVPVIYADGYRRKMFEALYRPYKKELEKTELKFIPYFAFANRGACEMVVWIQAD